MKKVVVFSFFSITPWPRPGLPPSEFFMVRCYANNNNSVLHTCRARAGHYSIAPLLPVFCYSITPTLGRDHAALDVSLRWVLVIRIQSFCP